LSDKEFFFIRITELKEEIVDEKINEALAREDFENAIASLEDFSNCKCTASKSCDKPYH